jgi:hypothetical protein
LLFQSARNTLSDRLRLHSRIAELAKLMDGIVAEHDCARRATRLSGHRELQSRVG